MRIFGGFINRRFRRIIMPWNETSRKIIDWLANPRFKNSDSKLGGICGGPGPNDIFGDGMSNCEVYVSKIGNCKWCDNTGTRKLQSGYGDVDYRPCTCNFGKGKK
jgi:hypothetical protein